MLKPITEEQLLQQKIEMLTAENKKLKNDVSKLHQSVKDLQLKNHELSKANGLLEATNQNTSKHVEDLINLNDRYDAQVTRLQKIIDTDSATIKRLMNLNDSDEAQLNRIMVYLKCVGDTALTEAKAFTANGDCNKSNERCAVFESMYNVIEVIEQFKQKD